MAEWLGEGGRKMEACDMKAPDLVHVRTVPYDLDCNWKVFNDNYLVRALSQPPFMLFGPMLLHLIQPSLDNSESWVLYRLFQLVHARHAAACFFSMIDGR